MASAVAPSAPRPRVCYALSSALISASNALPSNIGRSQMVHSLVYHFGLLNLPSVSDHQDESESHSDDGDEDPRALARMLAGNNQQDHSDVAWPDSCNDGRDGQSRMGRQNAVTGAAAASLKRAVVIAPEAATEQALKAFHSSAYVDAILARKDQQSPEEDEAFGLVDDCYRFLELANHVKFVAGASITAAKCLANDTADVAISWDGGRHHAHKSRAAGFCYVNDAVLAILELRKPRKIIVEEKSEQPDRTDAPETASATSKTAPQLGFGARPEDIVRAHDKSNTNGKKHGRFPAPQASRKRRTVLKRLERILYLDLDLHWGDGVEEAFRGSSSVLTLSIHNRAPGFYPAAPDLLFDTIDAEEEQIQNTTRGISHSLHVPLQPDAGPGTWARVWSSCVMPVLAAYEPEAIVVQCGLDGLAGDPMKQWNLDLKSILLSVDHVLKYARDHLGVKVLLLGGGGYDSPNAARGWTAITALALGRLDIDTGGIEETSEADTEIEARGVFDQETAVIEQQSDRNEDESERQQSQSAHIQRTCSMPGKGNNVRLPSGVLTLESAIPDTSPDWPLYGASATLDIPAGERLDLLNDEQQLRRVEQYFARMIKALESDKTARRERNARMASR